MSRCSMTARWMASLAERPYLPSFRVAPLDLCKHLLDVRRWKRMQSGGTKGLQLSTWIGRRLFPLCGPQRPTNPFSHGHTSAPRYRADLFHFTIVEDHLKALTHAAEYNRCRI